VKRIEKKSSRTARYTCAARTAAYYDKNTYYHIDDYIAPRLLPKILNILLKFHIINLRRKSSLNGIYEYVIARTKYIDEIFQNAIRNNFSQILIFGAGFDSRGIRFLGNAQSRLFELDSPLTQEAKIKQLEKRKIPVPKNIHYVPIDFTKESIRKKLDENGFEKDKKSLFILEGLVLYLDENSVRDIFRIIKEYSSNGSLVVFDYIYSSILRRENRYYGESDMFNMAKNASEAWTFGIEEGEIEAFLKSLDLKLVEDYNSRDLEERYFTSNSGEKISRVNGTHCIVLAEL
jgi:methyltransferase (TIGR00027 family)